MDQPARLIPRRDSNVLFTTQSGPLAATAILPDWGEPARFPLASSSSPAADGRLFESPSASVPFRVFRVFRGSYPRPFSPSVVVFVEPADARETRIPFLQPTLPSFRGADRGRVIEQPVLLLLLRSAGRTWHGAGGRLAGRPPCDGGRAGSCCSRSRSSRARGCGATA